MQPRVIHLWVLATVGLLQIPLLSAAEPAKVELRVLVQDAPAIGGPADRHAKSWAERTGNTVVVTKKPFGELFEAAYRGMEAKPASYDVIFYAPAWAGDFHSMLQPLPERLRDNEQFDDIHPTYRERMMKWGDEWVAVTVDGDLFSGYYRKDLFADPHNRAEFLQKHGYELAAPNSWAEYHDIACFFQGRKDSHGKTLYGTAEPFVRGGQQFWDLFSRASAYSNHPQQPGGQFFDPLTMKAQINNPAWVRALEEYAAILRCAPPTASHFGIVEARASFIQRGESALALDWGDTGQISADPKQSAIAGQVGFFVLPGSHKVWNHNKSQWDDFTPPYKAPFLAFGGWVASVPKNSAHQAAAWDYIMWYSSPENSLKDVVTSGSGINPYRYTHFMNIDAWTNAFSRSAASEYLGVLQASLDSPHVALDLRIPGFFRYTEALEGELGRVLAGELTAQQGLDRVAQQWEVITDQYGRDKLRAIYRASMGLSP